MVWRRRPSARRAPGPQLLVVRVFPLDLDEAPAPAGPVLAGAPLGRFEHITLGRVGLHGEDVLAPLVQAAVPPLCFQDSDGSRSYDRPLDLYQWSNITTPRAETLGLRWADNGGQCRNRARALRSRQSGCREAVCDARSFWTPSFSASSKTGSSFSGHRSRALCRCVAGVKSGELASGDEPASIEERRRPARRRPRPRRSRRLGALAFHRAGGARTRRTSPSTRLSISRRQPSASFGGGRGGCCVRCVRCCVRAGVGVARVRAILLFERGAGRALWARWQRLQRQQREACSAWRAGAILGLAA